MKRKLFVDLDGTLAEWRQAASMEDLLQEGYFSSLLPHKSLVEAVQELVSRGEEVYVLSAYLTESKYAEKEKRQWCNRWLPLLPADHVLLVPTTTPKCEYIESVFGKIGKNDFLLDDYSKNLHEWVAAGGSGIKYVNDVNWTKGTWQGCWIQDQTFADDMAHYIQRVMDVLGNGEPDENGKDEFVGHVAAKIIDMLHNSPPTPPRTPPFPVKNLKAWQAIWGERYGNGQKGENLDETGKTD